MEKYVNIGNYLNTDFYLHTISDNKFKRQITYKLLDILGLNPVIVYEFNIITLIWTVITNSELKYSKENLGELLPYLAKKVVDTKNAVQYNYDGNEYILYNSDLVFTDVPLGCLPITEIIYIN